MSLTVVLLEPLRVSMASMNSPKVNGSPSSNNNLGQGQHRTTPRFNGKIIQEWWIFQPAMFETGG